MTEPKNKKQSIYWGTGLTMLAFAFSLGIFMPGISSAAQLFGVRTLFVSDVTGPCGSVSAGVDTGLRQCDLYPGGSYPPRGSVPSSITFGPWGTGWPSPLPAVGIGTVTAGGGYLGYISATYPFTCVATMAPDATGLQNTAGGKICNAEFGNQSGGSYQPTGVVTKQAGYSITADPAAPPGMAYKFGLASNAGAERVEEDYYIRVKPTCSISSYSASPTAFPSTGQTPSINFSLTSDNTASPKYTWSVYDVTDSVSMGSGSDNAGSYSIPTTQTSGTQQYAIRCDNNPPVTLTISHTVLRPTCSPVNTPSTAAPATFTFTASQGDGSFTWSAPGGTTASGTGGSFTTTYNSSGTYPVTVTSAGQSATCTANVTGGGPVCTVTSPGGWSAWGACIGGVQTRTCTFDNCGSPSNCPGYPGGTTQSCAVAGTNTISASPNPIQVCSGTTGVTTINANATVGYDVRVNTNTGALFASAGANNPTSQTTGNWVTNGMQFHLTPNGGGSDLVNPPLTVTFTSSGCGGPVTGQYHCSGGACVVGSGGLGTTYTTSDCSGACTVPPVRYSCNGAACVRNDASGPFTTSNCNNSCTGGGGYACSGSACVFVGSGGPYSNSSCNGACTPPTRYSCSGSACISSAGGPYSDSSCSGACVSCTPACNNALDCSTGVGAAVCNNPGTCSSYCTYSGVPLTIDLYLTPGFYGGFPVPWYKSLSYANGPTLMSTRTLMTGMPTGALMQAMIFCDPTNKFTLDYRAAGVPGILYANTTAMPGITVPLYSTIGCNFTTPGTHYVKVLIGTPSLGNVGSTLATDVDTVTVGVPPPNAAVPAVVPTSLTFGAVASGAAPAAQAVTLKNIASAGSNSLNWTGATDKPWCHAGPGSGTIVPGGQQSISVWVDSYPTPGTFYCTATFTDNNANPKSVAVTVTYNVSSVGVAAPVISIAPVTMTFGPVVTGGAAPAGQTVTITNTGGSTMNPWTATTDMPWCYVTPASGGALAVSASTTATVTVGPPSTIGTFYCTVSFASPGAANTPQTLLVAYTVSPSAKPTINLTPFSFTFSATQGGATPPSQTLNIANIGAANLNWTASANMPWCHTGTASGAVAAGSSQNITVYVDSPSVQGSFSCQITVADPNATNNPQTAFVTYNVSAVNPTVTMLASAPGVPSGHSIIISYGSAATLTWTSTNATSCTASGAWSGAQATNGSYSTGPLTSAQTYTITCVNLAGPGSDTDTVQVGPAPPTNPIAENTQINPSVACGHVTVSWGAGSNVDSYYVYRSTAVSNPGQSGSPWQIVPGSSTSYDYAPPAGAPAYYYWVASHNNVTGTSTLAGPTALVAQTNCQVDFSLSDKVVTAVNKISYPYNSTCITGPSAPVPTVIKDGNTITFSINLCNSGNITAQDVTLIDTQVNLASPSNYKLNGVPMAGVTYNAATNTINFGNIGNVPANSTVVITYDAIAKKPVGSTQNLNRFKNQVAFSYTTVTASNNGGCVSTGTNAANPCLLDTGYIAFYFGTAPSQIEVR